MKTVKYLINNWFQIILGSCFIGSAVCAMITLIMSVSCSPKDTHKNYIKERNNFIMSEGHYIKGKQTGLCFFVAGEANGIVLTNVPCTPEVESLISHE